MRLELIGWLSFMALQSVIVCQPLADARSNYVNFFFEMLNPSWRQHRARLRPFGNQLGTPVVNVRGARDTTKQTDEFSSSIDCLFAMNNLVCFGQDKDGKAAMIECEARINIEMSERQFSMGKIQTTSDDSSSNQAAFKINLYDKEKPTTIMSMHSESDEWLASKEKGVRVRDKLCWLNMIKLFLELDRHDSRQRIQTEPTKTVEIVGYLVAL